MTLELITDDFLSGESGEVWGIRATTRAIVSDAVCDVAALAQGQRRQLRAAARATPRRRVLVLAVERTNAPNLLGAACAELRRSHHEVSIHTKDIDGKGKFENIDELLARHPVAGHDWLIVLDDDVALPPDFLDTFLLLAERYDLSLAQPAHRWRSHAAWRVTRRRPGLLVHETSFVEIGPVTAFHARTFETLLPFPPLRFGWGLELHWGALARERGWREGVVDATPIEHSVRRVASAYRSDEAVREARSFLADHPYIRARAAQQPLARHRRLSSPRTDPSQRSIVVGGPSVYGLGPAPEVGEELYERELVRRLPAHGVEVLLGMTADGGLEPTPGVRRAPLPRLAVRHWVTAPVLLVPWTIALMLGRRVDVLRAASVRYAGPSLLAARALTRSRIPVVIHHHHFEPRWRRLEAAILRRGDLVFTVSEHSRAALLSAGVAAERIRVVHNGIEGPAMRDPEPPATWPGDGLRLLYVGRLENRKRPLLAVETLAALVDGGDAASLVIAGAGPDAAAVSDRARALGVADRVRLLGRVDDARKWRLYDGAELLLFGSTREGFGLVVAEAQSRGLPVVAAAGTATAEALDPGRSGVLVAPHADAFAAAVRELMRGDALTAMGAVAERFAQRFSWDRCAGEVATTLRAVVSESGTRR